MARFPIINADGLVVNVVVADSLESVVAPSNHMAGVGGGEIGDIWDGAKYVRPAPHIEPPTTDDVKAERERRMALGFDYDFKDRRGVHRIGTTESDMIGWKEVTTLSGALIASGSPDATVNILTDTGPVQVTATEWQGILLAAAQFRQPLWATSFALQSGSIPTDYADDKHWP